MEVQAPFSRYILDGSKSIETRSYPLTDNLLGKSIMLCESTPGIDSVSAVNDVVPAGQADLSMIGEIIVSSCTEYMSQSSFDNDRPSHLVHPITTPRLPLIHALNNPPLTKAHSNTRFNRYQLDRRTIGHLLQVLFPSFSHPHPPISLFTCTLISALNLLDRTHQLDVDGRGSSTKS